VAGGGTERCYPGNRALVERRKEVINQGSCRDCSPKEYKGKVVNHGKKSRKEDRQNNKGEKREDETEGLGQPVEKKKDI